MATSLPWYFDFNHLPTGTDGRIYAIGDNAITSFSSTSTEVVTDANIGPVERRVINLVNTSTMTVAVPAGTEFAVGFRMNIPGNFSGGEVLLNFMVGASVKLNLYLNSDRTISVRRSSTVLGTSTAAVNRPTGSYVEIATVMDDTVGTFELAIDGVVDEGASGTGLDTSNAAGDVTSIQFRAASSFNPSRINFADLYIRGVAERHGPIYLRPLLPTADVQEQFTPSAGSDNYALVADSSGSDGASTYIESSTLGHRDIYTMENLPAGVNSIIAVVAVTVAIAPDGGAPLIAAGVRVGEDVALGAGRAIGTSAYASQATVLTTQPNAQAWSISAVNSAELVVEAA
jgi:hypothetical protein